MCPQNLIPSESGTLDPARTAGAGSLQNHQLLAQSEIFKGWLPDVGALKRRRTNRRRSLSMLPDI
jgi:hypothetical protein